MTGYRGPAALPSRFVGSRDTKEITAMDVAAKKAVIADFLAKCNRYAEGRLEHYRLQLASAAPSDALAIQDKIGHWTAYRAFNEHALGEIERGELDHWFA
jgi:hypothetical protein